MAGEVELHHATAIAAGGRAALIRGPSCSGKSDLALRCLALAPSPLLPEPARLVSDDQCLIARRGSGLVVRAPETLRGRLEARGLGIVTVPATEDAEVVLIGVLEPAGTAIERLPDPPETAEILGVRLPLLRLQPFEASAPIKLLLALSQRLPGHAPGR